MPVTIVFENGTQRDFPNGADAKRHGQGVIVYSTDGKEIFASDGPVASVTVNGKQV